MLTQIRGLGVQYASAITTEASQKRVTAINTETIGTTQPTQNDKKFKTDIISAYCNESKTAVKDRITIGNRQ